jgi:hypothetical protein
MLSLHDLQARFAAGLHGEGTALDGLIVGAPFTPAERLSVYRNNFLISLTGALGDVYPVVQRLVGEGYFAYLATRYIAAHPSQSGDIHEFGACLSEFIAADTALTEWPYLADVAALEWAWHHAFHCEDRATAKLQDLAAMDPEMHDQLCFGLHPSVSMHASDYPLSQIWQANQSDAEGDAVINLADGGETVVVARCDNNVQVLRVPAADFAFLKELGRGVSFSRACATATAVDADIDLVQALLAFISNEFIATVRVPENTNSQ